MKLPSSMLPAKLFLISFVGLTGASALQTADPKQTAAGKELIGAVRSGQSERARTLITGGADVNVRADRGEGTALQAALATGNLEIARLLLERGAGIDAPGSRDETPLMAAIRTGSRPGVDLILAHKPRLDVTNRDGETALMIASARGDFDTVSRLLASKADVAPADKDGRTALIHAARGGSEKCVRLLLAANADCRAIDQRGRTALMEVHGPEAAAQVALFLKHGVPMDARDRFGCTALMIAARRGELALVTALLDHHANPALKDSLGRTALVRALAADNPAIAAALRSRNSGTGDPGEVAQPLLVRDVLTASIRELESSQTRFRKAVGGTCFSCHNQSQVQYALGVARERGFAVDRSGVGEDTAAVAGEFAKCGPKITKALDEKKVGAVEAKLVDQSFPGGSTHIGYGLLGLESWDQKPDANTEAVARYLVHMQRKDGHWQSNCSVRAPAELSNFTESALALHSLRRFVTSAHAADVQPAIESGKAWLASTPPQTTEDSTFQLLGLAWAGDAADSTSVKRATEALLKEQRADGGWAQEKGMASDAYATGEVLVALHTAGGLSTADPAYRRGVAYLLRNVEEDGTWYVRSRAIPFQGYIETGYPGRMDQYISVTAATWATVALAYTLPLTRQTQTAVARGVSGTFPR